MKLAPTRDLAWLAAVLALGLGQACLGTRSLNVTDGTPLDVEDDPGALPSGPVDDDDDLRLDGGRSDPRHGNDALLQRL